MSQNLLNKYIWILDVIKRHGRITRSELGALWCRASISGGEKLSRRTFYNYRQSIEELFNINIECDPATYEYYIADEDVHNRSVTDWMLNSAAVSDVLSNSREVSSRIFLEDIPSAREHLATMLDAIKMSRIINFDYNNFTRSRPVQGIRFEPFVLKLFRQRWYVVGMNVKESRLKTYALDRMSNVKIDSSSFVLPQGFDPDDYFRDSFGIVVTRQPARSIVLRVDSLQAKYLRALPLHSSQQETVHDTYSLFEYRMRVTDDLVKELLSYGPLVTVISPPELRLMMIEQLSQTLESYKHTAVLSGSSLVSGGASVTDLDVLKNSSTDRE